MIGIRRPCQPGPRHDWESRAMAGKPGRWGRLG